MTILIEKGYFLPAEKQQIQQIIADNTLNSMADIYSLPWDSFKSYTYITDGGGMGCLHRLCKGSKRRYPHIQRTPVRVFQVDVPGNCEDEFEPKLIPKIPEGYCRTANFDC